MNLQVCFVNDSSSDKDSDAEDTRTETSLDTPLSPVVRRHCTIACVAPDSFLPCSHIYSLQPLLPRAINMTSPLLHHFLSRASRAHRCQTETQARRTRTHWMTAEGSGGCSAGCRRRHGWRWLWPDPWPACRWRWRDRSSSTDAHPWLTWLVSERRNNSGKELLVVGGFSSSSKHLTTLNKELERIRITFIAKCV